VVVQRLEITPDYYDLLVDWGKRLAHEGPFYRRLFERRGVRRVLDAACGTGQHLIRFRQWGLECVGSDADPEMIARARANAAAAGVRIDFFVARFADLAGCIETPFDAVLCVGNSLSMVPEGEVAASLSGLGAAVRPGGVLVLHVLNALAFAERRLRFLPLRAQARDGHTVLFQKIYEPRDDGLGVHFLVTEQGTDGAWRSGVDSSLLANRPPERLGALLAAAGFRRLEQFGDYDGGPLRPDSTDLVIVAER
jgi:glycine/sarcosine N-methyltransferase